MGPYCSTYWDLSNKDPFIVKKRKESVQEFRVRITLADSSLMYCPLLLVNANTLSVTVLIEGIGSTAVLSL